MDLLEEFGREAVFLIALLAMVGSLATTAFFGWETFPLSTYQRVLMYPLVLVALAGFTFGIGDLRPYALPFSLTGIPVAFYHYYLILTEPTRGCGFALPCVTEMRYVVFGYSLQPRYLPLLSFIAFTTITTLIILSEPKNKDG